MKKRVGRPSIYSQQVMFSLKKEQIEMLNILVLEANCSRSEYLRNLLVAKLAETRIN